MDGEAGEVHKQTMYTSTVKSTHKCTMPPPLPPQACERCPKSEDVWLEASRMYAKQSRDNAKAVLARGVAQVCVWGAVIGRYWGRGGGGGESRSS